MKTQREYLEKVVNDNNPKIENILKLIDEEINKMINKKEIIAGRNIKIFVGDYDLKPVEMEIIYFKLKEKGFISDKQTLFLAVQLTADEVGRITWQSATPADSIEAAKMAKHNEWLKYVCFRFKDYEYLTMEEV